MVNGRHLTLFTTLVLATVLLVVYYRHTNYGSLALANQQLGPSTGSRDSGEVTASPSVTRQVEIITTPAKEEMKGTNEESSFPAADDGSPEKFGGNVTTLDDVTDDMFHGGEVHVIGTVISGAKYAVFSSSSTNAEYLNYVFPLPLAVLAWRRLGYGSIVLLAGDASLWRSDPLLRYVFTELRRLGAILIFLETPRENEVMISQVSRIFASSFLDGSDFSDNSTDAMKRTYFVISDGDIWPVSAEMYELPPEKLVLSLNSDCCGAFVHTNGKRYAMRPMANVAMTLSTWKQITRRNGAIPETPSDLLVFLLRDFGETVVMSPVEKGENLGWYLDQRMLSVLLEDWAEHEEGRRPLIQFVPRDVTKDRIDRAWWQPYTLEGKVDAHVLTEGYLPDNWARLDMLLRLLYQDSEDYRWTKTYGEHFQRLIFLNEKSGR